MALMYEEESYAIRGACFEVYKEKGSGFLEPVYQECLALEFGFQKIPFEEKPGLELEYKGHPIEHTYEPDFICYNKIVLEIKASKELCNDNRAQLHNYLKATEFKLGFLVNFGHHPQLEIERIVH